MSRDYDVCLQAMRKFLDLINQKLCYMQYIDSKLDSIRCTLYFIAVLLLLILFTGCSKPLEPTEPTIQRSCNSCHIIQIIPLDKEIK